MQQSFWLGEVYDCTNNFLGLKLTQQDAQIDYLLDGSLRLLDICSSTRDLVTQIKEHIRELELSVRRRKGDISMESNIAKFNSSTRQMKKETKRLIVSLKQTRKHIEVLSLLDLDQKHSPVIGLLTEVSSSTIAIFQSLLMFVSASVTKPKGTRWSVITKLIHTKQVSWEETLHNVNESEIIDAALSGLYIPCEGKKIVNVQRGMMALEAHFVCIESNLEELFRRLIRTRTSLLNMASH